MSAIGWVDFSSEHREKVKSVLDSLSAPGVVDELGIGVIRDCFSDSLFPGISTVQTRAKYFLTVPRIFRDYERLPPHKRRRQTLSKFLKEKENLCMKALVANHQRDRQKGIIGASLGEVQRKPSSIYWTGIRKFGLIETDLSLQVFCRRFGNPDQPLRDLVQGSDKTKGDDPDASEQTNESINGPTFDDDWIKSLTLHLSHEEAFFLSHQIGAHVPKSLLGEMLLDSDVRRKFVDLPSNWNFTTFADEAPFLERFPDDLQRIIAAARDFWQLMRGAHIRYNCLLQKRHGTNALQKEFEDAWDEWTTQLQTFPWDRWETGFLWELMERKSHRRMKEHPEHKTHERVKQYTVRFVESWIDAIRAEAPSTRLDELVIAQERCNKKSRARLQQAADESIKKWVGIADLDYRLNQARTIIGDIHKGLLASKDRDARR